MNNLRRRIKEENLCSVQRIFLTAVLLLLATKIGLAQGDNWERISDMPTQTGGAVAGVVDGKIYIIGGISSSLEPVSTVEEYDPATDTYTTKSPMPTARFSHFSCVMNGKIFVFGGQAKVFGASLSTVEMYDPVMDTWATLSDLPRDRSEAAAAVLDDKIYLIGGQGGTRNLPLFSIEQYDPFSATWDTTKAALPTPRVFPRASVVNGKIYAIGGGVSGAGGPGLGVVEVYDPETDIWETKLIMMPTARVAMSTDVVNGKIYAIGGISAFAGNATFLGKMETYAPATDTWETKLVEMLPPRYSHATGVVDGKIYAFGGDVAGFKRTSIAEVYTPPGITSVESNGASIPISFLLHQNYPNPFNPTTTITYELPQAEFVDLSIYNAVGQLVGTLVNGEKSAGSHSIQWDASNLTSGIYFYRIKAGKYLAMNKALFLK